MGEQLLSGVHWFVGACWPPRGPNEWLANGQLTLSDKLYGPLNWAVSSTNSYGCQLRLLVSLDG